MAERPNDNDSNKQASANGSMVFLASCKEISDGASGGPFKIEGALSDEEIHRLLVAERAKKNRAE